MSIAVILNIVIAGICTGGLYGLISAAFSFQFGALDIINFAYGAFTMLGMYLTYVFVIDMGMNVVLFFICLLVVYFLLGFILRQSMLRTPNHNVHIIITLGIALIIENGIRFVWGAMPRTFLSSIPPTVNIPIAGVGTVTVGLINVATVVVAALVLIGFGTFLKRTWLGMTIRAVVQQRETAYLMGINSEKIINIGFGISFIITAIASLMLALQFTIEPKAGAFYQMMGFLVCLIAGMGNLKGGFFAGILVGVVSAVINLFAASWHDPILFGLFILVLLFFPKGVFTSKKNIARSV